MSAVVAFAPLLVVLGATLGWYAARRFAGRADEDRVRLLVDVVADAVRFAGDRSASDAALRRLAMVLGADSAAVGVVTGESLELLGMHGYPAAVRNHRLRRGEGLSGRAWELGEPLVVPDVTKEPAYVEGSPAIRSGIYVPGRSNGHVVVVIALESRHADAFGTGELRQILPVADLLAGMVESRRVQREAEALQERLLLVVGRQMRSPLATVVGSFATLWHHGDRLDSRTRRELVEAGSRSARRLERLVDSLLLAARLDAGEVAFRLRAVPLEPVTTATVDAVGVATRTRIGVPADLLVAADSVHLATVLHHLVEHAAHRGGGTIEVTAQLLPSGSVVVDVCDQGAGSSGDTPDDGLALHLARRLAEGMGGELELHDADEVGGRSVLRLPAATALDEPEPPVPLPIPASRAPEPVAAPGVAVREG